MLPTPHLPVAQSLPAAQTWSITHVGSPTSQLQVEPPQSTSVSAPSVTPFLQDVQTPPSHCPLAQSVLSVQTPPLAQPLQSAPPQSTSVSEASLAPLLQEVHLRSADGDVVRHCALAQSPSSAQSMVSAQV